MTTDLDAATLDIAIVTPVYNDFTAFAALVRDIGTAVRSAGIRLSILAIDDGSLETPRIPTSLPRASTTWRYAASCALLATSGQSRWGSRVWRHWRGTMPSW